VLFSDLEVPPTAAELIASDRMPAWLAECFDPALTLSSRPDWIDVADTIEAKGDSADPALRGVLALMTAYGSIYRCEIVLDRIGERVEEIFGLLDTAVAGGIDEREVGPLRWAADKLEELYAEEEEEEEEDGDSAPTLFDGNRAADAAYLGGDRVAALARYRAVADAETSGGSGVYEITHAWAMLVADAAEHEGAAAAREVWRSARARNDWFPWPGAGGRLIERLLGKGIPDILAEAVAIRRDRAVAHNWALGRRDREAIAAAEAELSRTGR
jgi:hypothetical protein